MNHIKRASGIGIILMLGFFISGCHRDMWEQSKVKTLGEAEFFADNQQARKPVPNTIPRGYLRDDVEKYTGRVGKQFSAKYPFAITPAVLDRGQQQYNIFCAPCHGAVGDGKGMIAQRGLAIVKAPASYHQDRLRQAPPGYFYDVITNGFGAMISYSARIEPNDRWAIAAYVKTLQFSQNVPKNKLTPQDIQELKKASQGEPTTDAKQSSH